MLLLSQKAFCCTGYYARRTLAVRASASRGLSTAVRSCSSTAVSAVMAQDSTAPSPTPSSAIHLIPRGRRQNQGKSWKAMLPVLRSYEQLESSAARWLQQQQQQPTGDDAPSDPSSAGHALADEAWTVHVGGMIIRTPVIKPLAPEWLAARNRVVDEADERFNVMPRDSMYQVEYDSAQLTYNSEDTELRDEGFPVRPRDGELVVTSAENEDDECMLCWSGAGGGGILIIVLYVSRSCA